MSFLRSFLFNRRHKKRYELIVPLKCICSCKELNDEGYLGYIVNVSDIGALVISKYQFSPRTNLKLTFELPEKNEVFSINSLIKRISKRNTGGWYSIGVEFVKKTIALDLLLDFAKKSKF